MPNPSLSSPSAVPASDFDADTAAWFFAQSRELFIVTDQTGLILKINPAWETTLGLTPAGLIGTSAYDLVHKDDVDALRAAAVKARAEGSAEGVFRVKTGAGEWRWLSSRSQRACDGRVVATLRDITDERVKAEETDFLRQAQMLVAETAGVSSWTFDPLTQQYRYPYRPSHPLAALVLEDFASVERNVYPDDLQKARALMTRLTREGGQGEFEIRFQKPGGPLSHFKVNYRCEPHPSGLHTVHALSQDITAVVEARDAARRGERMTREMIEAAPFAAALFDRSLKHLVVSRAWRTMLNQDDAPCEGRTLAELFPKARRRFVAAQARALAGETVRRAEDHLVVEGGRRISVSWEMQPWRDAAGRINGVLTYICDVSALATARDQAKSSAQRLKLAVSAAKAAVFEIDYTQQSVWHSPAFAKMAGWTPTFEQMNCVWANVHPDDRPAMDDQLAAFDTRHPVPLECRLMQPDGSSRWVNAHMEIFHDAHGRPRRAVGLLLDVDDRKRQELALADAKHQATVATEAKSRFLANISHEIRTPMNGVLGVLQLINREHLDADDVNLLQEGLASGRMLTELLDDLLDFSKIETGQFELHLEPIDPAQVLIGITSLLEPAASAKGLTMRATADPDLGFISADPLRLRQALYNMMGNAVKFTPAGSVEARLTRAETADGPRLRFEVQDTGVGVAESAQATLFERFEQADGSMSRKFGGPGLGLAITRRLAEMMGGAVGFSSRPGEGSTFWMEIGGDEVASIAANEHDADVGEFRVLLVEDNPTNRLVISKLLQALGVTVECAEDGEKGVAAAAKGGYDLVLMDIQMPGMDGMEATRRIRAMDGLIASTPVVAITANVLAEQKSNYAAAGMDGVVSKPVSAAALISEITRVTEMRAA